MVIAPKCFALASAEGSRLGVQFAICSFDRSSGAGGLAELVGVGRGL